MIVQSRCVRAVITGFATGLRWASVERAFGQLRSEWEENGRKWRACCMPALTMVVEQGKMKRAVLQLVFNWTEHCELRIETEDGNEEKKKKGIKMRTEKRRTEEDEGRLRRSKTALREWETLQKTELGYVVESVPPSAGREDEIPKIRCDR
jgi:hypothetical protein